MRAALCAVVLCTAAVATAQTDGGVGAATGPAAEPTTVVPAPTVPPPPTAAETLARTEFDLAQRHYDLGRFDRAIEHYVRAYEAMPLPPFLFNIAQCHRHLGQYDRAAFFYRRYLDLAGDAQNTALTRGLLAEMNEKQRAKEELEKTTAHNAARALTPVPDTPRAHTPLHKRPWVWVAVGGVAAATATAIAVAASQPPSASLGTLNGR